MTAAGRNVPQIARTHELPRTAVLERPKRLGCSGVVKRHTVIPDYAKVGKPVTALVLISFMLGVSVNQRQVAEQIAFMPDIEEIYMISGQWHMITKIRGRSLESIDSVAIDRLSALKGVGRTMTYASFGVIREGSLIAADHGPSTR